MPGGTRGSRAGSAIALSSASRSLSKRGEAPRPIAAARAALRAEARRQAGRAAPDSCSAMVGDSAAIALHPRQRKHRRRRDPPADVVAATARWCGRAAGRTAAPAPGRSRRPACCASSRLSRSRREQRVERLHRADFGRLERVEHRAAGGRNDLDVGLPVAIAAETRSTAAACSRAGHGQLGRSQGIEQRVKRRPLRRARQRCARSPASPLSA